MASLTATLSGISLGVIVLVGLFGVGLQQSRTGQRSESQLAAHGRLKMTDCAIPLCHLLQPCRWPDLWTMAPAHFTVL